MTCGKCRFLDKSRALKGNELNPIMYGCNKRSRGYVVGWIRKEKELNEMGVKCCSLGNRILRSETAPLYLMSVIGYTRELVK